MDLLDSKTTTELTTPECPALLLYETPNCSYNYNYNNNQPCFFGPVQLFFFFCFFPMQATFDPNKKKNRRTTTTTTASTIPPSRSST